jgi:hypothetical protein
MKTTAWTPSPSLTTAEFCIDDEVSFYSSSSKVNKRTTLMGALLAAGAYAGMNLPFEILNRSQEVLVVFEPGAVARGYPAVLQALVEVSVHLDKRAEEAVRNLMQVIKDEALRVYEQGVNDGIVAEQKHAQELAGGLLASDQTTTSDRAEPPSEARPLS